MKKIAYFLLVIVIIIVGISYLYLDYKSNYNKAKRENNEFESYYEKEIDGTVLATMINKAIDSNIKNEIQKDGKGKYIDNQINSIQIEVKILDLDKEKVYSMETFYNGGMENFIKYYDEIKFKCTKIEYHNSTNKIKYLLFEQISQ